MDKTGAASITLDDFLEMFLGGYCSYSPHTKECIKLDLYNWFIHKPNAHTTDITTIREIPKNCIIDISTDIDGITVRSTGITSTDNTGFCFFVADSMLDFYSIDKQQFYGDLNIDNDQEQVDHQEQNIPNNNEDELWRHIDLLLKPEYTHVKSTLDAPENWLQNNLV